MQAAARVGWEGRVIALDNSEGRLARLRENLERTRLGDRVEVALCDAASPELVERFGGRRIDAVLVDTPCSNSGVFARRPEARWRWSAAEVARLAKVQRAILDNVARLGARRIVYSTCSIDPEENDAVAASFAEESAGRHVLLRSRTLLPSSDHDGAFAALLRRV
jgi:16S rRNA (cytosine967-C5)-methyltransferase